jgi:hypothetical protein
MSARDDSGPAFPVTQHNRNSTPAIGFDGTPLPAGAELEYRGMTLRDYFAAKAMASLVASAFTPDGADAMKRTLPDSAQDIPSVISKWSYDMADRMLEARSA